MKQEIIGDAIAAAYADFQDRTGMKPRVIALNDYSAVVAVRAIRKSSHGTKGIYLDPGLIVMCSSQIPQNVIIAILKPGTNMHGFVYEIREEMKMGVVKVLNAKPGRVIPGVRLPGDAVVAPL